MGYSIVHQSMDRVVAETRDVDLYVKTNAPAKYIDGYVKVEGGGYFTTQMVDGTGKVYINGELVHDPATPSPTPPAPPRLSS